MCDRFLRLVRSVSDTLRPIDDSELRIVHYWYGCNRGSARDAIGHFPAEHWRLHIRTLTDRYAHSFRHLQELIQNGHLGPRDEERDIYIELGQRLHKMKGALEHVDPASVDPPLDAQLMHTLLGIIYDWNDDRSLQAYVYIFSEVVMSLNALEHARARVRDAITLFLNHRD
jgi:hypothetical protein